MTRKEQLKILSDKIKSNEADFNLNRQAAKKSALASGDLDKYEYLTGKETNYRSNPVEQKRFEYSPLGEVLNKGLTDDDKVENGGLLKRLDKIHTTNQKILDIFGVDNQKAIGNNLAIKGNNSGNNGGNKMTMFHKRLLKLKQDLINKQMLDPSKRGLHNFDKIVRDREILEAKQFIITTLIIKK